MRVTVRLFARLRDIAGAAELARDVAPGATIGSVWPRAGAGSSPIWRATSGRFRRPSTPTTRGWTQRVGDGDEVAFLPPVSGG